MTAFFHLGRLAEAAQAARIYLSFPDPLASQYVCTFFRHPTR